MTGRVSGNKNLFISDFVSSTNKLRNQLNRVIVNLNHDNKKVNL